MKWIALVAVVVLLIPGPALGQERCGDRGYILKELEKRYKEKVIEGGLTKGGKMLFEVLVKDGGETWTIIFTTPSGESCIMAYGEDWRILENELEEEEVL